MIQRPILCLLFLAATAFAGAAGADSPAPASAPAVTVYKSPTCGCCTGWADYLEENGFHVTVVDQRDLRDIKARYGIRPELQSCHTAIVDGYAIEGHVPVRDIRRLLADRPKVSGLTAPGMPAQSPGMAGTEPKGYDVLSFDRDGRTELYSRY